MVPYISKRSHTAMDLVRCFSGGQLTSPVVFPCEREIGLQVLLDDLVEGGLLGMAAAVWGRSASR